MTTAMALIGLAFVLAHWADVTANNAAIARAAAGGKKK